MNRSRMARDVARAARASYRCALEGAAPTRGAPTTCWEGRGGGAHWRGGDVELRAPPPPKFLHGVAMASPNVASEVALAAKLKFASDVTAFLKEGYNGRRLRPGQLRVVPRPRPSDGDKAGLVRRSGAPRRRVPQCPSSSAARLGAAAVAEDRILAHRARSYPSRSPRPSQTRTWRCAPAYGAHRQPRVAHRLLRVGELELRQP